MKRSPDYSVSFRLVISTMGVLALLGARPSAAATTTKNADAWNPSDEDNPGLHWIAQWPDPAPLGPPDDNCTGAGSNSPPPWINFSFPAFALPAGDLVTGIEVRIKIRTVNPDEVQLTDSGTLTGVTKVVPSVFEGQSFCSSTAFTPAIGGDGDLWGTGFTAADFNAGTVGFRITHTHNATTDLDSVELTVHHGPANTPPDAMCQDVTVSADGNCQGAVAPGDVDNGSSDPDGDPITLSLNPSGPYSLGDTMVTLTVEDDNKSSDTCTATITVVDDTQPQITCPSDATLECPADTSVAANGTATATDNCDPPNSVVISSSDSSVPGCGNTETITRTWTATDGANLTDTCDQIITVVDTTDPVITCPDDVTVTCPESTDPGATGMATATDNCSATGDITIESSDVVTPTTCPADPVQMVITRTWTATDECGKFTTCDQTITV
ncbi:MAG: hypothetical protein O7D94_04840, partial [Planctomycetota bacterium]|nr:hypothetical protein [Planctomycetota bacterium]